MGYPPSHICNPCGERQCSMGLCQCKRQCETGCCSARFLGRHVQKAFLDVRVFNPSSRSNWQASLKSVYRRHEQEKKRQYEQRVREVEHATFTPI